MGQVLHDCATTTEAVRRTIQRSQAGLRVLAKRYGINQKTVAKWKKRTSVADLPTGPKDAKSTVLSVEDEAIVVALPYLCQNKAIGGFQISGETVENAAPLSLRYGHLCKHKTSRHGRKCLLLIPARLGCGLRDLASAPLAECRSARLPALRAQLGCGAALW
jgi:hypothetical protein